MAIGVSGGNNPFDLRKLNNAGVAQNNQTGEVSSTETETPVDTASKLSGVAGRLRAQISGPDGFGKVDPNKLIIAGLDPSIKLNGNTGIPAINALEQSSAVTATTNAEKLEEAIGGPEVVAAITNDNAPLKAANILLASLANVSNAQTIEGNFNVSTANAELEGYNRLLVG